MENAPLTLAYTHARNAAQETKRSNPVAASEEHDLAAAEFAAAAATTTDKEAIRVLKLLEAHHRQLGHILKDAHLKPASAPKIQHDTAMEAAAAGSTDERAKSDETGISAQPPRLARTGRGAGRDLSSSIANNLASARGIPSARQKRTLPVSPLVSNEHADAHFTKDSAEPRRASAQNAPLHSPSRPSWAPPQSVHSQAAQNSSSHSPFQQFYSKFESAISTLTAPLAFTSLPLTSPPSSGDSKDTKQNQPMSPQKLPPKADPSSSSAVDFSQLISNAALRAVQDNNDSYSKPHESFYLVQTSGGTMSYADITAASYIDRQIARQHRRNASSTSNDDFVDASSQFLPPSAKRAAAGHEKKLHGKTMEELQLENAVLRRTLNETTKRVHGHEFASQQVTAMLAQSVRSLNLSPVTTPENSRGKTVNIAGDPGSELATRMKQKRIDDLEAALEKYNKRLSKRDEENAKLKETLGKYREKWEGLKAGAKARREQAGAADKSRRTSGTTTATMATASTPTKEGTSKPSEDEVAR